MHRFDVLDSHAGILGAEIQLCQVHVGASGTNKIINIPGDICDNSESTHRSQAKLPSHKAAY